MSPPLAPDLFQNPEERARNAFNRVATAAWLAYQRGQISRAEYQRGILAAHTTYELVLAHPELAPPPPRQPHGAALQEELVQQAVRMLHRPPPRAPGGQQAGPGEGKAPAAAT
ncbi:MAG: hypothetical protein ACM32E_09700 [Gemmatimonadota bacterium]